MGSDERLIAERESTHWADCWRVHLPCAVVKINRLSKVVRIQRQELLTIAAAGQGRISELAARALKAAHRDL